ncbi:isatin hydrolase-like [Cydia splendana]|uniref:isatin hydrolase-like n=1 Tax=Cydia splendana TaxID=1100963 RepID=UPI002137D7CC
MWLKIIVFMCLANVWANVGADNCKLNDIISNGDLVFNDLSHTFDEKTIYWPYVKPFAFTKKTADIREDGWYASNEFEAGEHGGTHMDAPYHFYKEGKFVGEIPMEKLILPLIIVDISSRVNNDPNFVLNKHHLDYLLNDNNGKPCMIIFRFGWSKFYGDKHKYLGMNETAGTLNFPGLSQEVAEWITTSYKNVVGIGVDTPSLDPGSSTTFPVHRITMTAGLYGMENVKLDTPVPEYGCTGVAMPMKIAKGTGGPLRLAAICPKTVPTTF